MKQNIFFTLAIIAALLILVGCDFGGKYHIGVRPGDESSKVCESGEDHILLCKDSLISVSIGAEHDGPHDFMRDYVAMNLIICNRSNDRLYLDRNVVTLFNRELQQPAPFNNIFDTLPRIIYQESCDTFWYSVANSPRIRHWNYEGSNSEERQAWVDHIVGKVLFQLRVKDFVSREEKLMEYWFIKRKLVNLPEFVTGHGHVFHDFDLKYEVAERSQATENSNVPYTLTLKTKYKPRKEENLGISTQVWDTTNVYLAADSIKAMNAESKAEVSMLVLNPPVDSLAGEFRAEFNLPMDMNRVQLKCFMSIRDNESDRILRADTLDINLLLLSKSFMATLTP